MIAHCASFPGACRSKTELINTMRAWDKDLREGDLSTHPWYNVYPDAYEVPRGPGLIGRYDPTYEHHDFMKTVARMPGATIGELFGEAEGVLKDAQERGDAAEYKLRHSTSLEVCKWTGVLGVIGGISGLLGGAGAVAGAIGVGGLVLAWGAFEFERWLPDHYAVKAGGAIETKEFLQRWGAVLDGKPMPVAG